MTKVFDRHPSAASACHGTPLVQVYSYRIQTLTLRTLTNVSLDYDEKMDVPTIWLCLLSLPPSPRPVAFLPQPQADACLGPPRHSSHLSRRPRLPFLRLPEGSRWPPAPAAVVIFPWRSAAQISTVSLVALLSTSLTCPCPAPSPIQSLALRSPCL